MKQVAGQFPAHANKHILDDVVKRVPMLAEKNLTPYQGLLARDLDRRADQRVVRIDQDDRSAS